MTASGYNSASRRFRPGAEGSKIKSKKLQPVQDVLRNALKQFGLDKNIARYQFVLHWPEIVGADIAKISKPECIRNEALVVRVNDSAWAQELSFQKEVILSRLKKFMNDSEIVNDVMFYVAPKN